MRRRISIVLSILLLGVGVLTLRLSPTDTPDAERAREQAPDEARTGPSIELAGWWARDRRHSALGEPTTEPAPLDLSGPPINTHTSGLIVDEDGSPVVGATVAGRAFIDDEITSGPPCTTNSAGQFDVEVLNDDVATLTVVAPGFIERTVDRSTSFTDPLVLRRENRSRVRFHVSGQVIENDRFLVIRADETMTIAPASPYAGRVWPPKAPQSWVEGPLVEVSVVNGVLELPTRLEPGVTRLLLLGTRGSAGPVWVYAPPHVGNVDLDVRILPMARLDVLVTRGGVPVYGAVVYVRGDGIGQDLAGSVTDAMGRLSLTTLAVPGRTIMLTAPVSAPQSLPEGDARAVMELPPPEREGVTSPDRSVVLPPEPGSRDGTLIAWPPSTLPVPPPGSARRHVGPNRRSRRLPRVAPTRVGIRGRDPVAARQPSD